MTFVSPKPNVLIPIAVIGLIALFVQAINLHRKKSKQNLTELKRLLLEEVGNIKKTPSKNRLDEYAAQIGIQLEEYFDGLIKGPVMDKGLKALMEQDYQLAADLFEKNAKDLLKEAAVSWFFKGNAFYFQGDYYAAIAVYQKAINFNPRLAKAWYNWGVTLEVLGQHGNAKMKYQKALEYDQSLAEVGCNLHGTPEDIEQTEKEIEKFGQTLELKTDFVKT
jgi:tetratricopeptide (TPR) repeat protein